MRLTAITIAILTFSTIQAQKLVDIATQGENNWLYFNEGLDLSSEDFVGSYGSALGLTDNDELMLYRAESDDIGFTHYRYRQHHNGIPVEAATYLVHQQYGFLKTANGKLVEGLNIPGSPAISAEAAISAALAYTNASVYMWESTYAENMLKRIENDQKATHYPSPELVVYDPAYSDDAANYSLCWKMDIYASEPYSRNWVYVDAQTGNVVGTVSQIHEDEVPATAETRYSGTQTMLVDSITPGYYVLREYTRGDGIETYNMNEVAASYIPDSAVDFFDADNYWNNANPEFDDAATDVHWGNQKVYDYYWNEHSLDSYDGNGKLIVAYVHVGVAWFNARFTGNWMEYGDGTNNPLTSIDVVGHEMTHGVTRNSANLVYSFESGALNESFSDIFGTAVERYALPDSLDWEIGQVNFTLRDMSDPNAFSNPDTYQGTHWEFGFADNGGVHTNSGVQNHWFYLLADGGSGVNDNSDSYNVTGVGFDDAEDIAYRNLLYYLTESSNYADARQGSIQAAADLYGACSFHVQQTIDAWYAVGVGSDTVTHDVKIIEVTSPATGCQLTAAEEVTTSFLFHESGCGDYILPTDSIRLGYNVNGGTPVIEYYHPTDTLWGTDTVDYTFANPADLSAFALHDMKVWVNYSQDAQPMNDSVVDIQIRNPQPIASHSIIIFPNNSSIYDSLIVEKGAKGRVDVHTFAANGSGYGLRLSGENPDGDRSFNMPGTAAEIWTNNPAYYTSACFCVDATTWSTVNLAFDLRMQYSAWYFNEFGYDLPNLGSTMRVSVDGVPVSPDYHPTNYQTDPFDTKYISLDSMAGRQFQLCFEGMCFVKIENDISPLSKGDNAFIDNIWITEQAVSVPEQGNGFEANVFPNPSVDGSFHLTAPRSMDAVVQVVDLLGKVVWSGSWIGNQLDIKLDVNRGVYQVTITQEASQQVETLIVH